MKNLSIAIVIVIFLVAGGYVLWSTVNQPRTDSSTVAILPFQMSGSAASGQYALQLDSLTDAVSNRLGQVNSWKVVEHSRKGMLVQEIQDGTSVVEENNYSLPLSLKNLFGNANEENENNEANSTTNEAAESIAVVYDAADYVLLGRVNSFEVRPERAGQGSAILSRRVNRIKSIIDVRIVDVETRTWLTSQTITIDEVLSDENSAETQIQQAVQIASAKVVNALLRAEQGSFTVIDTRSDNLGQWVGISGGSQQGVEQGLVLKVLPQSAAQNSSTIEITEVRAQTAVGKVISGNPVIDDSISSTPVTRKGRTGQSNNTLLKLAIGGFSTDSLKDTAIMAKAIFGKLRRQLQINLQQFDGISIYEDDAAAIKKMLSKQMLDDLSKGREPALPLGTLKSVDYLIFGVVENFTMTGGKSQSYEAFGTTITETQPLKNQMDGTIYIVDVNSGEYILGRNISSDMELKVTEASADRLLSQSGKDLAHQLAGEIMLAIRPLAVMLVNKNEFILNHKKLSGLALGDRFSATGKGGDIYDENTQTWLKNVGGETFGDLEITAFDASGWARASLLEGQAPPAGALLKKLDLSKKDNTAAQPINW